MASQPHAARASVTTVGDGGSGTMHARMPELNETVITRYTLRERLNKLDELRP